MSKKAKTKVPQVGEQDIAEAFGLGKTTLAAQQHAQNLLIESMSEAMPASAEELQEALVACYTDGSYCEGKLATPADEYFASQLGVPLRRGRKGKKYALYSQDCGEVTEGQKRLQVALKGKLDAEGRDKFTSLGSTLWFNTVCGLARTASEYLTLKRAKEAGVDLPGMRKALALNIPKGTPKQQRRDAFEALEAPYKVSVSFEAAKSFVASLEPKRKSRKEAAVEAVAGKGADEVKKLLASIDAIVGK